MLLPLATPTVRVHSLGFTLFTSSKLVYLASLQNADFAVCVTGTVSDRNRFRGVGLSVFFEKEDGEEQDEVIPKKMFKQRFRVNIGLPVFDKLNVDQKGLKKMLKNGGSFESLRL